MFIILSLLALLFLYEDEVKSAIVSELNKHLKAEVKIDPKNIDLTIIKTFPDCSIEFKEFLMLEALPAKQRDTLLFAGRLNLYFNIEDLWNKKYEIQKIKLKNGVIKLLILKNGKNNYTFWDEGSGTGKESENIAFNLKLITLENSRLVYKDKQLLFKTEINIKKIDFKGNFSQSDYDLASEGKIFIQQVTRGKTSFLKNKNFAFSIDLTVKKNHYIFKKADLKINRIGLNLSGDFLYKDSLQNLNLKFNAPDLDIASVLSLLPEKLKKNKIDDYESSGTFYANGSINYHNKKSYSVSSDFGIKNGKIIYKPNNTTADQVNIDGYLKFTQASSGVIFKNINLNLNNDQLSGSCSIDNFSDPFLRVTARADLNLENLQNFWPIDTLTLLKGKLRLNTHAEGLLSDLRTRTFSTKVKLELEASVLNLETGFKGDEKLYSVENCSITAKDREIEVKDLMLKRGSSDLKLNGRLPGIFNYLVDRNSPLIFSGNLYSNYLKLEDFIPAPSGASAVNNSPLIAPGIEFKLNAAILKFSFGKFEAQSVTAEIEIKNQKAIISDVKMQTMQGEAEINAYADNSKNKLEVVIQSTLKKINITDLFSQLNNFGQVTLQNKNIKGLASAEIEFSGSWNNSLEADYKSIQSTCNINIEKGELIDFKPLQSLSKYVGLVDLQRIKFLTLQSNIRIRNSVITIPKTTIKNSALNIDLWGSHTFDDKIDYHIQLLISELLSKKRKKQDDDFGPVENDKENRRSAFILMTGTVDNPIIKFDKKGMKEKIKIDIKQEKQNIKQLLKEEFGLFKKDTVRKKPQGEEQQFELEKNNKPVPKKTLELKKKKEDDDF